MTTTNDPPHAAPETHDNPQDTARPEPIDPENDIDARTTAIWVVASAIVLYASLYFMVPVFDRVMNEERREKVNEREPVQYEEIWATEQEFLNGEMSDSKKTIEDIMVEMVNNK